MLGKIVRGELVPQGRKITFFNAARHVPTPPPNTEFNSVLRQRLKMRLSPKLTPII